MQNIDLAAIEERRRYHREWRRRNKDKVRNYARIYWERQAQKRLVYEPKNETGL